MISKSFRLFFLKPLVEFYHGFLNYIYFTFNFFLDVILLRNINDKSSEELLKDTFQIFKIIIFFIVSNIAFNEIFRNIDSNILHELKSEGSYLAFFYFSFLGFYYISRLYEKITSNVVHKVIVIRYLLFIMLSTILFFQIDGLMNPDFEKDKNFSDLAMNDLALIYFFFVLTVSFQGIYLLKKKIIRWYDVLYYILMTASIFVIVILNGIVLLLINDIQMD